MQEKTPVRSLPKSYWLVQSGDYKFDIQKQEWDVGIELPRCFACMHSHVYIYRVQTQQLWNIKQFISENLRLQFNIKYYAEKL